MPAMCSVERHCVFAMCSVKRHCRHAMRRVVPIRYILHAMRAGGRQYSGTRTRAHAPSASPASRVDHVFVLSCAHSVRLSRALRTPVMASTTAPSRPVAFYASWSDIAAL